MKSSHIIVITADELRKDSLSCYGNRVIQTPNLDKLAQGAYQFDKAYTVSPWCLPSRCAVLTGRFPHNTGAYSNFRLSKLDKDIPNLFSVLRENNYYTSMIGKCHFAPRAYGKFSSEITFPEDELKEYYLSLGLDDLLLQDGKMSSIWVYNDYSKELDEAGYLKVYREMAWNKKENQQVFPFPGPPEWHPDSWVGRKTVDYINQYDHDKSLCMWVSFSGPHYPFDAPKEYYDKVNMEELKKELRVFSEDDYNDKSKIQYMSYNGGKNGGAKIDGCNAAPEGACKNFTEEYWLELKRNYYANVVQIDEYIGEILSSVEKKFGDDVLVIFTADHGEMLGNHGLWGKNNCAYEDVLNVPLIVKYPGQVKSSRTDIKVMLTDIMATCMKVAKVDAIETDGMNFEDNLEKGGYSYVISEGEGFFSISNGTLKYVHVKKGQIEHYEMYNLTKDPMELKNVIDLPEYTDKLTEMRKEIINIFIKKLMP